MSTFRGDWSGPVLRHPALLDGGLPQEGAFAGGVRESLPRGQDPSRMEGRVHLPRRGRQQAVARGFLRFFIAAVLLATAAGKLLDIHGFATVLDSYGAVAEWALLPLAVGIPLLELAVGLW